MTVPLLVYCHLPIGSLSGNLTIQEVCRNSPVHARKHVGLPETIETHWTGFAHVCAAKLRTHHPRPNQREKC